MTIHSGHPFATPEPERDPARRLRGRLGGAVTLWTSGDDQGWAGLSVSSLMVAGGEPARVLALLDPDSDLVAALSRTGRGVVHLLGWEHRDLADVFAGLTPAPGGPFAAAEFEPDEYGPRLVGSRTWARLRLESEAEVGWSRLVTLTLDAVHLGQDEDPLVHRRGRYRRL